MTGLQAFVLFALTGLGLFACLADIYYTETGVKKGLVEGNPINKFLFSKLGVPFTGFLETAMFIFTAVIMGTKVNFLAGCLFAGAITALETFNALRNRKLVK